MEQETGLLGAVAAAGGAVGKAVGDMFMAEKQLTDRMAAVPGSGQQFKVEKDTVLQAGKLINDQIVVLRDALEQALAHLTVRLNDADEVNADIADAWNSRLVDGADSYSARVEQYIASLSGLVNQLRGAARQYEFTEDEVTAALGAAGASH
ncbi:hypothetical protein [Saccharothrix sp. NRRL B-16348]|uniref:hypothetical protein n=1 Tax=Saccharothrix sp. NRRL B-16348 TaxID=1415542 RepID=UPI0006AFDFD3|nr:hypothetical protein [Saccharothrix sp. NRRL B-16348]